MKRFKHLTAKEEEVMQLFWTYGEQSVWDLVSHMEDPKPHFNTVSTVVRTLEMQGYVDHRNVTGGKYRYYPLLTAEQVGKRNVARAVEQYFKRSFMSLVSGLVADEKVTPDELRALLREIEEGEARRVENTGDGDGSALQS